MLYTIKNFIAPITKFLRKTLRTICAVLIALMTSIVVWGVITRYIYGEQSVFTDELARTLLVCLSFFGGALAFADGVHVGLIFLKEKFSISSKKVADIIGYLISLLFVFAVLVCGGIMLISTSIESSNELITLPISMWHIYLCVPFSGFFASVFLIENIIDTLVSPVKKESK